MGITYGFEAEFTSNARPLIAALHRNGWSTMTELHPWHCHRPSRPCDHCDFEGSNRLGFRGQTDSSCDGEIISPIFGLDDTGDDFFTEASTALQENAVDVDAEPGRTAGMHVHVKPVRPRTFGPLLWEFTRWEQVVKVLASGPFSQLRQGMNSDVGTYAQTWFEMYSRRDFPVEVQRAGSIAVAMEHLVESDNRPSLEIFQEQLREFVANQDRHANLAFSQRHGTAELRIWNSTRSAWRMRMYTGVSRLFADPEFLDAISRIPLDGEMNAGFFTQDLDANILKFIEAAGNHDGQVGELLERQREFQQRGEYARRFTASPDGSAGEAAARRLREREARRRRQRVMHDPFERNLR